MRNNLCVVVLACLACALPCRAQQIEAYPVPITAEIGVAADSKGKAAPPPAPAEKVLRLIAPRNGVANGQIVLKAKEAPAKTSLTVADLAGPGGAKLNVVNVQVRYGQYITGEKALSVYRWRKDIGFSAKPANENAADYGIDKGSWRIDALLASQQCEVEPDLPRCAWLTFAIPTDAAAGMYKGSAKLAGGDGEIPIELEVVDALVPDLAGSAMSNDVRPMWEVIALGNGIALEDCWKSDEFWKVTAAYLEKLGQLRVNTCGISILAPSTSSSLGMVKWTKKGDVWSWDYAVLDRFIETYRKMVGEPRVVEATALVHDEKKPELSFLYVDEQGKAAFQTLPDGPEAADVAVAFVKDLTAHLATLKLDKKLVVGVWHDKMQHKGGTIRERLLKDLPDLKVSLWAHSDGWGMPLAGRVGSYMAKCHNDEKEYPYLIKCGMRPALEKPVRFGPMAWDTIVRNYVGLGQTDLANWSEDRRAKEYTYYGAGMFSSWQRHLVYPMQDGQVVTGILYELFREYAQDYELLKLMQAKSVKSGFLADPRAAILTLGEYDKAGGRLGVRADSAKVEAMHSSILREAGQAKVRPEGK